MNLSKFQLKLLNEGKITRSKFKALRDNHFANTKLKKKKAIIIGIVNCLKK